MPDNLSVSEAQQRIIQKIHPTKIEKIELMRALNRVLAADIVSPVNLPLFDNSSMDGFAVIAGDTAEASPQQPIKLKIVADIPAGSSALVSLHSGEAARIMTGGMIPAGADAVVPVENTGYQRQSVNQPAGEIVKIMAPARVGENIRKQGQNAMEGEPILKNGRRLTAQDIGAAAALGIPALPVYQRPRVALLTTGDELLPPGKPLGPGKIFDSNSYMLATLVEQYGGEVLSLGIAPDDPLAIHQHLEKALEKKASLILSSAGVSVGNYDYVKMVVEESGELDFWRVNMRPGKPIAFGSYKNTPIFGLPGNPVSAFVGFLVFVVPALHRMAGLTRPQWPRIRVRLEHPVETDGRETYFRATVRQKDGQLVAGFSGNQNSDNLIGLTRANTLLIIPSGVKSLPIDSEVDAWLLGPDQIL